MRAATALPGGPPPFRLDIAPSWSALGLPAGPPAFTGRRPGRDFFAPAGRPTLRPARGPGPDGLGLARLSGADEDPDLGVVVEAAVVVGALVAVGSAVAGWAASRTAKERARHTDERIRQSAQIMNETLAPFTTPAASAEDLKRKLMTPIWSIHSGAEGDRRIPAYAVLYDIARAAGLLGQMPAFQKWAREFGLAQIPPVGATSAAAKYPPPPFATEEERRLWAAYAKSMGPVGTKESLFRQVYGLEPRSWTVHPGLPGSGYLVDPETGTMIPEEQWVQFQQQRAQQREQATASD